LFGHDLFRKAGIHSGSCFKQDKDLPEKDLPEKDLPEKGLPEKDLPEKGLPAAAWQTRSLQAG
jgi:hypothetical protein